jgi:hypothetical protein
VDIYDEEGFAEAVVFLEVQLWVTGFTEPACPELFPERKTVHFRGRSIGGEDNESNLRGRVKMTREGKVLWELVFSVPLFIVYPYPQRLTEARSRCPSTMVKTDG